MIKFVIKRFELVSGLRVNFFKIFLYHVNGKVLLIELAESLLNFGVGSLSFNYI